MSKDLQYITIKQYDKQLKIDNQILQNDKIIKADHSSFLIEDTLSDDSIAKLNILQKDINKTYLISICESLNQKVISMDDLVDDNCKVKKLNSHFNVSIPKEDINTKVEYFNQVGCDYIFSPFNILYNHISTNGANTNSLNMFILNNIIYALILDDNKKIVHSSVKTLTAFEDVNDSEFTGDNLEGQKLFDEIHLLEIQDNITSIMNEFYEQSEDEVFCESVAIFYSLKQLNSEQIVQLQENIMLEIEYSQVNVNEYLFHMSKQATVLRTSFIVPREKKESKSFLIWLLGAIVATALVGGIFIYIQNKQKAQEIFLEEQKQAKVLANKKAKLAMIKLPNHRTHNVKVSKLIRNILGIIPDNAVLNELQLQKKELTFVCNLLGEDIFEKQIQPNLLKLYKTAELLLIQKSEQTYNAIIATTGLLEQPLSQKQILPNYKKNKFVAKSTLIEQIQAFLPKKSKIVFKSKYKSKFLTYNFDVTTVFQEPNDFFNFMKEINKKSYSITVKYPIEFAQTKNGLESTFKLQFNQFHKK